MSGQLATRAGHRQDIGGRADGQAAAQTSQVTAVEHAHQQPAGRGDQLTSGRARTAQGHSHHRTLNGPDPPHPATYGVLWLSSSGIVIVYNQPVVKIGGEGSIVGLIPRHSKKKNTNGIL